MLEMMSTVLCKLGGFILGSFEVKDGKASNSYPRSQEAQKLVWIGLKLASKVNVSSSIYTQNKSKRVFRKKNGFESQSGVRF